MTNITLSVLKRNNTWIIVSAAGGAVQFDVSHGTDGASGTFIV
jgi:hypothetical protein